MEEHTTQTSIDLLEQGVHPRLWRRVIGVVALAMLVAALWLVVDREAVMEWKSESGPIPFFIALSILPAIGFPTTPFFVLAGALYGVWIGLGGSAIAISVNLILCYWISKSSLRPKIIRLLSRRGRTMPDWSTSRSSALKFAMIVKVAPGLPTFAKNYVLGMAGVPFWIYFSVSFGFTAVYAASLIVLGESIFTRDYATALVPVAVLAVLGGCLVWYRLSQLRRKAAQIDKSSDEVDPRDT